MASRAVARYASDGVLTAGGPRAILASLVNRARVPVDRVEDAQLQLWVAATPYETAVGVHDRVFRPAPNELADELHRSYAGSPTIYLLRWSRPRGGHAAPPGRVADHIHASARQPA